MFPAKDPSRAHLVAPWAAAMLLIPASQIHPLSQPPALGLSVPPLDFGSVALHLVLTAWAQASPLPVKGPFVLAR